MIGNPKFTMGPEGCAEDRIEVLWVLVASLTRLLVEGSVPGML